MAGPHVLIHCLSCERPILLPSGTLQQPFSVPEEQLNDTLAIGVVCTHCKHARRYLRHRQTHDHSPLGRRCSGNPRTRSGPRLHSRMRRRESRTSTATLAQWNISTSEGERKADTATWHWEKLRCPEGHLIENRKPRHIAYRSLHLRDQSAAVPFRVNVVAGAVMGIPGNRSASL